MISRKQLKEERDKASNIYFGAALLIIFLMKFVEKIITAISHIFPFDYLLQGNRFHLRKSPEGLTSINIIKEAVDFGDILG